MKDIMKIFESLEQSRLLIGVSKTKENEAKEQKGGFLSMLLGASGASLLKNLLIRAREELIGAGQDF